MRTSKLVLPNCDLDDGIPTGAAEYTLADETYANLLAKLSASKFDGTTPQLRANILAFYSDLSLPIETRKDPARWQGVLTDLGRNCKPQHPCRVGQRRANRVLGTPTGMVSIAQTQAMRMTRVKT